jgi:putative cell wall-binding protein
MRVGAMVAAVLVLSAVPVGTASGALAAPLTAASPAVVAASTSPAWTKLTPAISPSVRDASLSAFDPATGQLVLYGGAGGFFPGKLAVDDDTWTFDGASWSKHVTSVTPGEQDHLSGGRMAYDPASKQLVLFGGGGGDTVGTWTWNGSQWTQQHPAQSPVLPGGCMATDSATGELVLFGLHTVATNTGPDLTWQTWTWRGGNWVELPTPAVSPQGANAQICEMTYDEAHQDLVLVTASWYAGEFSGASPGETWTFDGTTWTQRETLTNTTGGVDFSSMTYDPAYGQVMTYGGFDVSNGNAVLTNPWAWNGSTWQQVTLSPAPGARVLGASAYDPATGQLVLFGGVGSTTWLGDTWVLSGGGASSVTPARVSGADRQATAVAVSASAFPSAGSASAVVLARANDFADALAGGPLAAAKSAPLLLTSSGSLDAVTSAEIQRVLPNGGTVYLLGGTSALSDAVASAITALGDVPMRIAGADRYATAVAIAGAMGNPTTVFEASGTNFPDALSAVPAAVALHGAILLTNGSVQAATTSAYLTAHATSRYAVGGPAAYADPSAIGIAGADRYATSDAVALAFFPTTAGVSVASGANFPDALAAGPVAGVAKQPVLLVPASGALPEPITSYLNTHAGGIASVQAFGGTTAVADAMLSEVAQSIAAE